MASNLPPTATLDEHDALPAGARLGELEIIRVLGVGGFGIVYLARDHALEREVALKEYMPSSLAGRGQGGYAVSIRSGAHSETYALGLRSFVNEARLLARFNHPSLVKVYRFWEGNGTAYMVMPYLQGRTLREVRRSMDVSPTQAWIRSVIDPLMDALELLHSEGVYHRDIAPDNILLPPGELPVLLDFGAARRAIGDSTQTFTAILKPSYAPLEQYAEATAMRQGPWTDVYALGAVVYYLLRGAPPPPATARAVQDDGPLLPARENPDMSPQFLAAIEWALAIRPADRPQSIAALRDVLEGRAAASPQGRTGTLPSDRTLILSRHDDTTYFTPTVIDEQEPVASTSMDATWPMPLADEVRTYPPVGQRAELPPKRPAPARRMPGTVSTAAVVADDSSNEDTTVITSNPKAAKGSSSRRAVWAAMGIVVAVGLGVAAWMMGVVGSRAHTGAVAGPVAGASALAAPAALDNPAAALGNVSAPASGAASDPMQARSVTPAVAPTGTGREQTAVIKPASSTDKLPQGQTPAPAPAPTQVQAQATADLPASIPHRAASMAARVHQRNAEKQAPPVQAHADSTITPREACSPRVFLALAVCMEEVCESPRFRDHPQCERVRAIAERRRRNNNINNGD